MNPRKNSSRGGLVLPEHIISDTLEGVGVTKIEEIPKTNKGAYFYYMADGKRCMVQFSDYERHRAQGIRMDVMDGTTHLPKFEADHYFFFQKHDGALKGWCTLREMREMLLTSPVRQDRTTGAPYKALPLKI